MDADDDPGGGPAPTRTPFYTLFPLLVVPEPWNEMGELHTRDDGVPRSEGDTPGPGLSSRGRHDRGI